MLKIGVNQNTECGRYPVNAYYCQLGHLEKRLRKRKRGFNCRNSAQIHKLTCKEMTNGVLKAYLTRVCLKNHLCYKNYSHSRAFSECTVADWTWNRTVWNTRMRSKLPNKQNMNSDMSSERYGTAYLGMACFRRTSACVSGEVKFRRSPKNGLW